MEERNLVDTRTSGAPIALSTLLRGPAADVGAIVANLKAELEAWVDQHPNDYVALVLLGELNLRVGLKNPARAFLYRASLLKPPSWEAYQRTSLLLRRAEEDRAHELDRVAGAAPPVWLRRTATAFASLVKTLLTRRSIPLREAGA